MVRESGNKRADLTHTNAALAEQLNAHMSCHPIGATQVATKAIRISQTPVVSSRASTVAILPVFATGRETVYGILAPQAVRAKAACLLVCVQPCPSLQGLSARFRVLAWSLDLRLGA